MRVEMMIAIDVPGAEHLSDDELRQKLSEGYMGYAAAQRAADANRWTTSQGTYESAGDMGMLETARSMVGEHAAWRDAAKQAELLDIKRVG